MTISQSELGIQLLGAHSDGVLAFDLELKITYWNRSLERLLGLREDQVRGQPLLECFPVGDAQAAEAQLRRVCSGDSIVIRDLPFLIPATGRSGFIECSYSPLRSTNGALGGGLAVVRDVTERHRVEAESREMESRFQRMADSSPVLLWMAGLDGECNFFNQTWLRFTGRTLAQEYGVGWSSGVHPLDFQHCIDTYIDHFNIRQPFEMEYRLLRADGEYRWILDRGAPRWSEDGTFAGFIGSCTDITDRKNAELALQKALGKAEELSRLKSEFLANISHELRTPLNAIINIPIATLREFQIAAVWECAACKCIFEKKDDPTPPGAAATTPESDAANLCPECGGTLIAVRRPYYAGDPRKTSHFLDRLVQASQHMLKVINDLLDFSKLDAGRVRLFIAAVSTHEVLTEVAQTISTLIDEKRVTVHFPPAEANLLLHADRVKLTQMLLNLIGNAVKYTPEGGVVTVRTFPELVHGIPFVGFAVEDNGVGIPKDKLEVIFESFRQADGGHTRAHQGTGLGLSITRKLVELHGGRIWVKSTEGVGSTFTFLLPQELGEAERNKAPDGSRGRVLVVDDNPADLEIARANLEREGFDVALIGQSELAISAVEELQPDCVILDIMMPKMSGLTILRLLKESPLTRAIPVLVSTAYHSNHELVRGLGGIWLPKPWDAHDLMACVRGHIGQYRSSQASASPVFTAAAGKPDDSGGVQ